MSSRRDRFRSASSDAIPAGDQLVVPSSSHSSARSSSPSTSSKKRRRARDRVATELKDSTTADTPVQKSRRKKKLRHSEDHISVDDREAARRSRKVKSRKAKRPKSARSTRTDATTTSILLPVASGSVVSGESESKGRHGKSRSSQKSEAVRSQSHSRSPSLCISESNSTGSDLEPMVLQLGDGDISHSHGSRASNELECCMGVPTASVLSPDAPHSSHISTSAPRHAMAGGKSKKKKRKSRGRTKTSAKSREPMAATTSSSETKKTTPIVAMRSMPVGAIAEGEAGACALTSDILREEETLPIPKEAVSHCKRKSADSKSAKQKENESGKTLDFDGGNDEVSDLVQVLLKQSMESSVMALLHSAIAQSSQQVSVWMHAATGELQREVSDLKKSAKHCRNVEQIKDKKLRLYECQIQGLKSELKGVSGELKQSTDELEMTKEQLKEAQNELTRISQSGFSAHCSMSSSPLKALAKRGSLTSSVSPFSSGAIRDSFGTGKPVTRKKRLSHDTLDSAFLMHSPTDILISDECEEKYPAEEQCEDAGADAKDAEGKGTGKRGSLSVEVESDSISTCMTSIAEESGIGGAKQRHSRAVSESSGLQAMAAMTFFAIEDGDSSCDESSGGGVLPLTGSGSVTSMLPMAAGSSGGIGAALTNPSLSQPLVSSDFMRNDRRVSRMDRRLKEKEFVIGKLSRKHDTLQRKYDILERDFELDKSQRKLFQTECTRLRNCVDQMKSSLLFARELTDGSTAVAGERSGVESGDATVGSKVLNAALVKALLKVKFATTEEGIVEKKRSSGGKKYQPPISDGTAAEIGEDSKMETPSESPTSEAVVVASGKLKRVESPLLKEDVSQGTGAFELSGKPLTEVMGASGSALRIVKEAHGFEEELEDDMSDDSLVEHSASAS